uniref:Dharma n=1 Tax=Tetraodon nigroviridis TaxID=99883 RepID=H3C411_TETNG
TFSRKQGSRLKPAGVAIETDKTAAAAAAALPRAGPGRPVLPVPPSSGLQLLFPLRSPLHLSGPQEAPDTPLAGYHGYHAAATPAQAQLRQRVRVRTVFTDAQVRQLEALFDLTDYPPAEARAELARSSGLSEETVRVWFKNRRARRKQQRSGSRVKSSSSPCGS